MATKNEKIAALLQRKAGVTRAEILKLTGWPTVSVQAVAKACGLKLRKEKTPGEPTRYYGTAPKGKAKKPVSRDNGSSKQKEEAAA